MHDRRSFLKQASLLDTPQLPQWPAYSAASRDTMVFNHVSRVVKDPDREQRLIMEQVLMLT